MTLVQRLQTFGFMSDPRYESFHFYCNVVIEVVKIKFVSELVGNRISDDMGP